MKRFLPIFLLLALSGPLNALDALPKEEAQALCARIEAALLPPQTAEYRLRRHSDLLEQDMHSSGTMEIPAAGVIYLHQKAPVVRETVLDAASARFPVPQRLFDEKVFRIECYDEGPNFLLVLTPLRRDLSRVVGSVELRTAGRADKVQKVRLNSPDGGYTLLELL